MSATETPLSPTQIQRKLPRFITCPECEAEKACVKRRISDVYSDISECECDVCYANINERSELYHCNNEDEHDEGFDMCVSCAFGKEFSLEETTPSETSSKSTRRYRTFKHVFEEILKRYDPSHEHTIPEVHQLPLWMELDIMKPKLDRISVSSVEDNTDLYRLGMRRSQHYLLYYSCEVLGVPFEPRYKWVDRLEQEAMDATKLVETVSTEKPGMKSRHSEMEESADDNEVELRVAHSPPQESQDVASTPESIEDERETIGKKRTLVASEETDWVDVDSADEKAEDVSATPPAKKRRKSSLSTMWDSFVGYTQDALSYVGMSGKKD